jgi:hypothetical protein
MEDDMLLHVDHIILYIQRMETLNLLCNNAPMVLYRHYDTKILMNYAEASLSYYGSMTERMLSRIIPGFIRVEVVMKNTKNMKRYHGNDFPHISISYQW